MARKKQETLVLFPEVMQITRKFTDAQFGALIRAVFSTGSAVRNIPGTIWPLT